MALDRQVTDLAILRVASGPMRKGLRIARWHAASALPAQSPLGIVGPPQQDPRVAVRTDVQRIGASL